MATIHDVAKLAGVSITTVSRVLNGYSSVNTRTRNTVLAAIEELGYKQGGRGRTATRINSRTILVISNNIWTNITDGITDAAREAGFDAVCLTTLPGYSPTYLRYIESEFVEGVILLNIGLPPNIINMISERCPVVQCGECQSIPGASLVEYDNERAAYDLASHLISRGRRRLALVSVEMSYGHSLKYLKQRADGFERALREHGLKLNPDFVARIPATPRLGVEEYLTNENRRIEDMLSLREDERPDGIIFTSDMVAVGCIEVAKRLGISIPGDLSVMAFDNTAFCLMSDPRISSLAWPGYKMGYKSAKLLAQIIDGKSDESDHILLDYEIILRGTD